jgi:hypothetical protein
LFEDATDKGFAEEELLSELLYRDRFIDVLVNNIKVDRRIRTA